MQLKNKVILVTGAAGGIGQSLCQGLANQGATVIASDASETGLQALKKKVTSVSTVPHDVTSNAGWQKILSEIKTLDVIINNAGVLKPAYATSLTEEEIDFHFNVNVKGVILGSSLAARKMQAQGSGHIINVASLAGVAAIPGISLYSASKFAVRGFTLAIASELRPLGIKVTVVCPDAVKTPMLDLQVDYEEAALTFSGDKALTADEIASVIINTIGKDTIEVVTPLSRGLMAKLSDLAPDLTSFLIGPLREAGLKNQQQFKKGS